MGKDVDGCCESCKLFGDAPVELPAVPPPALRATFEQVKIVVSRRGQLIAEVLPDKERVTAGRVSDNDIVMSHGTISKRQFMLVLGARGVVVVDTQSACGTLVDGINANRPTVVPEGATIYAGDFQIRIVPR